MDPQTFNILAQIALVSLMPLLGIIGWLVQDAVKTGTKAREQLEENFTRMMERYDRDTNSRFAKEAGDRALALAEADRAHRELEEKFNGLQREVDKEYVNFARLEQIVRPLRESIESMRKDVIAVFDKLDSKQDKSRSSGHHD